MNNPYQSPTTDLQPGGTRRSRRRRRRLARASTPHFTKLYDLPVGLAVFAGGMSLYGLAYFIAKMAAMAAPLAAARWAIIPGALAGGTIGYFFLRRWSYRK